MLITIDLAYIVMKMCKSFFSVCFSTLLEVFSEMEETEGTFTFNWLCPLFWSI